MASAGDGIVPDGLAPLKRRLAAAREPSADAKAVAVHRKEGRRPADLSLLHARQPFAALLATRVKQQADAFAETLAAVGLPAAVVGPCGEVLAVNKRFTALAPNLVREIRGPLRLTDPVADRLVGQAVADLDCASLSAAARAIPIRTSNGKLAAIAHLIVVKRVAGEPLSGICGILIIVPMRPRPAPSPQILQRLFGLSPAEARVACGVAGRQTLDAIARDFGISRETVRSQLKTVLAKTGAKRQLDLAVLLSCLLLPKL